MKVKPTNIYKHLTVPYITLYYKYSKPPTCACLGHSYGHSQGGAIQSIKRRKHDKVVWEIEQAEGMMYSPDCTM